MSSTDVDRIKEQLRDIETAQDKYVYFLLATSAAGIAYAMQRTSTTSLKVSDLLLGIAILYWMGSFYAGCRNRHFKIASDSSHLWSSMLEAATEAEGKLAGDPTKTAEANAIAKPLADELEKRRQCHHDSADNWFERQFKWLVRGALLMIGWHVFGMYERINPQPSAAQPPAIKAQTSS